MARAKRRSKKGGMKGHIAKHRKVKAVKKVGRKGRKRAKKG